jgi:hypothetical protein
MQFLLLFEIKQPAFELRCIEIELYLKLITIKSNFQFLIRGFK